MTIIFSLIISLLLIGSSYIVTEKNAKYYLAGYWNLTPEKRNQVDLKGFIRNWKRLMWISGGIINAVSIVMHFIIPNHQYAIVAILLMIFISFLVLIITGRKHFPSHN